MTALDRDELAGLIGRKVDQHLPGLPMAAVQAFMRDTADAILAAGRECPGQYRWRLALNWIGTQCETTTVGRCWDYGNRTPDAEYGADRWCDGCLAAYGLGEGPEIT